MTTYEVLLTLHVLAAIVWLGGSIMVLVLGYLQRSAPIEQRVGYTKLTERVGNLVFAPASILLILAGSFLVDEAGYDYSDTWVILGYAGWFVSFVLGVGFYGPQGKRRDAVIEANGISDPGVAANVDRVLTVATFDTLIITLVVLDMTTKPFL
ncbi:MAG: DUF2269 domain-containing protein [Actinomycetota bacterium]|nr:DUF2269 domain-containing protein [Actinomycetota bacterium]